ncbi:MAG TPA: LLM class flavin-dependent oxidoreductase [Chloroflexota bacterium]|nr:LLM class flavin-dependent oxidoreductase [Chloroflexota bacterium]
MRVGFYTWGSCFVESPGPDGPDPYSRHHSAVDYERAYAAMLVWAKRADALGYDSFWLTEHHFQREGYEVVPNVVLLASVFAQHTRRITFGSFFHVVPTWHPLRIAEDLALADLLTGGRVVFGAGRGSVEREARVFGVGFGRNGDDGDRQNRELFEEQMEIIRLAWTEPEFAFHGKHYTIPPEGILNTGNIQTGRPWRKLSLVPQPKRPIRIYQACSSDETLEMCARAANTGVLTLAGGLQRTRARWQLFGEHLEQTHGRRVSSGEKRMLVVSVHLAEDRASALAEVGPPLVERARFLAQQRPVGTAADGTPLPVNYVPPIDEMVERGNIMVGSVDDVREQLLDIVATLGAEEIAVEMGFPGMLEDAVTRQIELFATGVRPALDRFSDRAVRPVAAAVAG